LSFGEARRHYRVPATGDGRRSGLEAVMLSLVLATVLPTILFGGMPMTTIAKGGISNVMEPREVVARSAADWTQIWHDHAGPDADVPSVDFGSSMVVGVFLGARNTGGYAVEITAVEPDGTGIVVKYTESKPGPGAMLAQVITSPFQVVSVARADGPVRFERTEKTGR
jgi:hypothetical protein